VKSLESNDRYKEIRITGNVSANIVLSPLKEPESFLKNHFPIRS